MTPAQMAPSSAQHFLLMVFVMLGLLVFYSQSNVITKDPLQSSTLMLKPEFPV